MPKQAATASKARVLDVSVLALRRGQHAPVVTLENGDPASYVKHDLRGFLDRIGFFKRSFAFVELLDGGGRFAWSAGRFGNGGMVHSRPDLGHCSPVTNSQPLACSNRLRVRLTKVRGEVRDFVRVFMSAALGISAVLIAVYATWLLLTAETLHLEIATPAFLLALVSAATAVVLWRRAS